MRPDHRFVVEAERRTVIGVAGTLGLGLIASGLGAYPSLAAAGVAQADGARMIRSAR
jgi:hypothetical protein